jgi:hypothetical protein
MLKRLTHWAVDKVISRTPPDQLGGLMLNSLMSASSGTQNGGWGGLVSGFGGEKTEGGFGLTLDVDDFDYFELREKSLALYYSNPFARGIINRLIINSVGSGLKPESTPNNVILGLDEETIHKWTEKAESLFQCYSRSTLGDYLGEETLDELQLKLELNALLCGDVLVIERINHLGLPNYEFIDGRFVNSPMFMDESEDESKIVHGVKLDKSGKTVSFFVQQRLGDHKEIQAYSSSGRRQAWLAYGTKRRIGEVRGYPLLMSALQALKQLDKYTTHEITAAELNATIVGFVKRTEDTGGNGSTPFVGGVKPKSVPKTDSSIVTAQTTTIDKPGMFMQGLQVGEEPVSYNTQRPNVNHSIFVRGVLSMVSYSLDMPPEILFLEFDSSYSAARQVNNEFSLALSEFVRPRIIANFPQRSWRTFITYQTLSYKLTTPMLFESLNNESLWDIKEAWFNCDWIGPHRKPIDPEKEAKANVINVDRGWKTNQKASLEGSGSRFSSNIDRLKGEKKLSEGVIAPPKSSSTVEEKNSEDKKDDA